MTKIKPGPTRSEKLAADLSRDIVEGLFPPGTRLDEHTLARHYGVSRTPVREALKRLAGLDLVEVRPRRGVVVANMTANRVNELFEALAEAEAVCARLAAVKRSEFELERLVGYHEAFMAIKDDSSPDATSVANRVFHEAVYAGAHNAFLADHVMALRKRLAPFTTAQFWLEGRPAKSAREHAAVLAAIHERDGNKAADSMRRHITMVGHAWSTWSAAKESSDDQAPSRNKAAAAP